MPLIARTRRDRDRRSQRACADVWAFVVIDQVRGDRPR